MLDVLWAVGSWADDIVLMAPTATAVRQMLAVCDEFAVKLDVRFNASKCMFFVRESHKNQAYRIGNARFVYWRE